MQKHASPGCDSDLASMRCTVHSLVRSNRTSRDSDVRLLFDEVRCIFRGSVAICHEQRILGFWDQGVEGAHAAQATRESADRCGNADGFANSCKLREATPSRAVQPCATASNLHQACDGGQAALTAYQGWQSSKQHCPRRQLLAARKSPLREAI